MPEIDFGLLQPVDVGALTQQGFSTGMAMVKHVQTQHALQSYLANPDNPQAYNALAAYDPEAAATIQNQQLVRRKLALESAQQEARKAAGAQAASGDVQGGMATALSSGDTEFADALSKLDDAHVKKIHDGWQTAASLAYRMRGLSSNAERQAYWQENRPVLESQGVPTEVLDKIDPTNIAQLDGIIAQAQKVTEQVAADRPQVIATQPGGGAVAYSHGQVTNLVIPNTGDHPFGAPPTAAPSTAPVNNPGNLREPGSKKFQSFATPEEGIAAQHAQLNRYLGRGINTVGSIIETYAPRESKGGDNTDAQVNNYIHYVSQRTGLDPSQPISADQVPVVAQAMREFETGQRVKTATSHDAQTIREAAQRAIAAGADPQKVRARAAEHGVSL